MSQANLEEFREICGAISAFDADAVVALCDPEVEFQSRITAVDEETYRGLDGVRRWIARLEEAFDWMDVAPTEVIGDDEDRVVLLIRFRARGRGSGAEVEQHFFQVVKRRDGRAFWWRFFDSKEQALEAAGLSE
jgi:ketosteroid isomerase-like protein